MQHGTGFWRGWMVKLYPAYSLLKVVAQTCYRNLCEGVSATYPLPPRLR